MISQLFPSAKVLIKKDSYDKATIHYSADKMLEECSSDSTEEFNIDVPCSCLVNAVSINVNYDDYKAMENNQEGVFLPVEIEMQEEVLEAMINCGVE